MGKVRQIVPTPSSRPLLPSLFSLPFTKLTAETPPLDEATVWFEFTCGLCSELADDFTWIINWQPFANSRNKRTKYVWVKDGLRSHKLIVWVFNWSYIVWVVPIYFVIFQPQRNFGVKYFQEKTVQTPTFLWTPREPNLWPLNRSKSR